MIAFSPEVATGAFPSSALNLTSNAFESKPPTVPGVLPDSLAMAMPSIDNVFVHDLQMGQTRSPRPRPAAYCPTARAAA